MGKYLYFGDSNIGMFTLSKNRDIIIRKYKGASARGLSKAHNENRIDIIWNMNRFKPSCAVFNFGVVDLFFSVYYKLFQSANFQLDSDTYVKTIADGYTNFLKELADKHKHTHFYIIAPHYSPVRVQDVPGCVYTYGVLPKEDVLANLNKMKPYIERRYRNGLVDAYIARLEHNFRNMPRFHVINIMPEISSNGIIHDKYIVSHDLSLYNIHLCWETTILHYVKYLSKCGLSKSTLDLSNLDKYLEKQRKEAEKRKKLV